jgi:hypothetical protein
MTTALDHFSDVRNDNYVSEDGSYRKDYGVLFDRADIWICRRCGAMIDRQCANHAILHVDLDAASGRV